LVLDKRLGANPVKSKRENLSSPSIMSKKCVGIVFGGLVMSVAIGLGILQSKLAIPDDVRISLSTDEPKDYFHPISLTEEQIQAYRRDGALYVKQLIPRAEAMELREASDYAASRVLSLFDFFNSLYNKLAFDLWRTNEKVASLSLEALPKVAAAIMADEDPSSSSSSSKIRILRDAFFKSASGKNGCGWHVDDPAFWPTSEQTSGLTIWIALDDILVKEGGGLAIANMSLASQSSTEDPDVSVESCRKGIQVNGTCNMKDSSPKCHDFFESVKLEFDMEPGDAMLWDRWTFHRGSPFTITEEGVERFRYSVRYMPSTSKAAGAVHPSIEQGGSFEGSAYYPQVYPTLLDEELKALEHGLDGDITIGSLFQVLGMVLKRKSREFVAAIRS
jgi:hypothetical protein